MGMGIKSISSTFRISRNTVRKYARKYLESGLTPERLQSISEEHLQEMFCTGRPRNPEPSARREELDALLPDYAKRLSRKGVTVMSLYAEYNRDYPDGYKEAAFKRYLRQYRYQIIPEGHVEHLAGDQMYIDYAGDKLEVVDEVTGEVKSVEVFVATLPCSQIVYCEAVWSQRKEDLICACENALRYFGGVPMAIVPDNMKSAVIRSDKYEAIINPEFASFAEYYDCAVYPARVRHPKDKALVENAVKLLYRSVYADLEGLTFHDLESMNEAMRESLERFNDRKLSRRKESRRELFLSIEADFLRPLPERRYQMKSRKSLTVQDDSYVCLNKHYYSVPTEYIKKRVDVIYDADNVEIYHGLKLITTHMRDDTPYAYSRKDAHNLPGHHGSYEKDLDEIYRRASEIDNIVLVYLKEVSAEKKYPPKAFRACKGILSLEKKYGLDRLVAACACASGAQRYGYNEVRDILERGDDAPFLPEAEDPDGTSSKQIPLSHKNIRGKDYYSNNLRNKEHGNEQ